MLYLIAFLASGKPSVCELHGLHLGTGRGGCEGGSYNKGRQPMTAAKRDVEETRRYGVADALYLLQEFANPVERETLLECWRGLF